MSDQLGVGCDAAAFLLSEHLIQFHNRYHAAADDLLQYSARAYGRKLVAVTYKDQSGIARCSLQKLFCQVNIFASGILWIFIRYGISCSAMKTSWAVAVPPP